ncbi:membrane protein [Photobacterium gaetbulicola]|uniref:3-oxo-tetronate kinase n=1 Tax=Photobacterium gaetbulicola TaxID=1295392 RepID=A0A0B9GSU7_9GAMM|nr:3-oxo-tetronate kinase [Photobacterium gaetbulicola]KHT61831.1 membrane protein [Photobacterium gaetbulicola]
MRLGVIADDFTGGTDIASFLVKGGMQTIQTNGIPVSEERYEADAIVVSLKSRSCITDQAIEDSLTALTWLKQQGCTHFYFKYCSTFDSTAQGNIGPVTDALLEELDQSFTLLCPSLPVNGRTVHYGNLFVKGIPLNESGMQDHPVTPMIDANLLRLMDNQAEGRTGLIDYQTVDKGVDAVKDAILGLKKEGYRYAVIDAFYESHLATIAAASDKLVLMTGGSGLGFHLAQLYTGQRENIESAAQLNPVKGAVVLSGSCSKATNEQVKVYRDLAPSLEIDIDRCMQDQSYPACVSEWVMTQQDLPLAPLVSATVSPEALLNIQQKYGAKQASDQIESFFSKLTHILKELGVNTFIVAGGETSGVVTQQLDVAGLRISHEITAGVPWVVPTEGCFNITLKSGNFGNANFFADAQEFLNV